MDTHDGWGIHEWGVERIADLADLVEVALPAEPLTVDDLVACSFDDDGVVLGNPAATGAVVVVARRAAGLTVAHVQLVAVAPEARRRGLGRALFDRAEGWAREQGAAFLLLGGAAPWYLWPGVDVDWLPALCLAEASGFSPAGCELNLAIDVGFRAAPPDAVTLRRVLGDGDADAVLAFVGDRWPHWVDETRRGVEHGACFAAFDGDGVVVGFACHSVNRLGWLGPMGVDAGRRGDGLGGSLVAEVCRDLQVASRSIVEISWVGPVRFYAKLGARAHRAFRTYHKQLAG